MATNRRYEKGDQLKVVPTAPDVVASGDPVLFGTLPGVALTDEDADGAATVQFTGVFELDVVGVDSAGNAAITAGDPVYYDAGEINADVTNGTLFGYALTDVAAGATTATNVKIARV